MFITSFYTAILKRQTLALVNSVIDGRNFKKNSFFVSAYKIKS